jgi:hypothetical protein
MFVLKSIISLIVKPHQFFNFKLFNGGDDKSSGIYGTLNRFLNAALLYTLIFVYIILAFFIN